MPIQKGVSEIRAFNRFYTNVISILDQSVLKSGYSLAEARILYEISQQKPCSARQVMDSLTIDEGYLSRILSKLGANGLIRKVRSSTDKRQYQLELTNMGEDEVKRLDGISSEHTEKLVENLSESQISELTGSMNRIKDVLSSYPNKPKLEEIEIRTAYKSGDPGYMIYMHGLFYQFGSFFEAYVAETLADFYKTFDPEKERVWIAEYRGKMIGTIVLKNTDGMAQLRYFLIDPEFRGIGLGKKLMDQFMAFMKDAGYTTSFLLTEKQLETAVELYKRYGYQYVSSSTTDFDLVEMRYELKLLQ
ncbi:MAG: helix-turn-helix domain-containing GNAT family N-acetyltransferase [Cyclobacteriaceae bacterium]